MPTWKSPVTLIFLSSGFSPFNSLRNYVLLPTARDVCPMVATELELGCPTVRPLAGAHGSGVTQTRGWWALSPSQACPGSAFLAFSCLFTASATPNGHSSCALGHTSTPIHKDNDAWHLLSACHIPAPISVLHKNMYCACNLAKGNQSIVPTAQNIATKEFAQGGGAQPSSNNTCIP